MQAKLTITALMHTALLSLNYTKTYLGLSKNCSVQPMRQEKDKRNVNPQNY